MHNTTARCWLLRIVTTRNAPLVHSQALLSITQKHAQELNTRPWECTAHECKVTSELYHTHETMRVLITWIKVWLALCSVKYYTTFLNKVHAYYTNGVLYGTVAVLITQMKVLFIITLQCWTYTTFLQCIAAAGASKMFNSV